jgi:ATP-dependent DNA helicase DinG
MTSDIRQIFKEGGELSRALEGYELRPQQVEVSEAVGAVMDGGGTLLAEAATGTGKGQAYLMPAGLRAKQRRQKTLVATATIALQGQLINKDLPLLTSLPSFRGLTYALAKGSSNYACKKVAVDLVEEDRQGKIDAQRDARKIAQWAENDPVGDRENFPAGIGDWGDIAVDLDACPRSRCEFYDSCHYWKAKATLEKADIVVANIHLLMADLQVRQASDDNASVLPEYDHLVIDEAHNLRDTATSCLGIEISAFAVAQILGRLKGRKKGGGAIPRYIATIAKGSCKSDANEDLARELLAEADTEVYPEIAAFRSRCEEFFKLTEGMIMSRKDRDPRVEVDDFLRGAGSEQYVVQASVIAKGAADLAATIREWMPKTEEPPREQIKAQVKRLLELSSTLRMFIDPSLRQPNECIWIEVTQGFGRKAVLLKSAPIDVAEVLRPLLFENDRIKSVTLTSATLSSNGNMDTLAAQVGATEPTQILVESPFDFANHARLLIPFDFVAPQHKEFDAKVADACAQIARQMMGRSLFLFTSYRAMSIAYDTVKRQLVNEIRTGQLEVITQGNGTSKSQMIEAIQARRNVILFGTQSFWEGVDIRGDALTCVVIAKLPFSVPSDPVEKARAALVEARGGNPFMEISVPEATIKIKQGFGRLIRSATDKGVVVILDNRLVTKPYGKRILRSLPPAMLIVSSTEACLTRETLVVP